MPKSYYVGSQQTVAAVLADGFFIIARMSRRKDDMASWPPGD